MDRQSDDSSRRADSDSHPENWTDHEANDPPNYVPGSPPKSEQHNKTESSDRRSRLFTRDRGTPGSNKSKKQSLSVDLKPPADLNSSEVLTLPLRILSLVHCIEEGFEKKLFHDFVNWNSLEISNHVINHDINS